MFLSAPIATLYFDSGYYSPYDSVSSSSNLFFIIGMFSYAILWVVFAIIGYAIHFIARIKRIPNTKPINGDLLLKRYLEINSLRLTVRLNKMKNGFKIIDTEYSNYGVSYNVKFYDTITTIKVKLNNKKKQVLYQKVVKTKYLSKKTGDVSSGREFATLLNLRGWRKIENPPYVILNGKVIRKPNLNSCSNLDLNNLLIEICIMSGWEWKPVLFLRLKPE